MPNQDNITSPLLVIGPGRSGSSWLVHALQQHPDVQALIENQLVDAMHNEIFKSWWSPHWHWICDEAQLENRAIRAVRRTMVILFESPKPQWVMKAIWKGRPWAFFEKAFPNARYLHITRCPTTAVPSMMEYLGRKNPAWSRLPHVEDEYVSAHEEALAIEAKGLPYLRLKQEDAAAQPAVLWRELCAFCGLSLMEPKNLDREINAAESTSGKVKVGREPMPWTAFSPAVVEMAARLGYEAPGAAGDVSVRATSGAAEQVPKKGD